MKSKYLGWKITGSYIELITACVILRELGLMSLDNHIPCDHYCVTIYRTGYYGLTNAASAENSSNSIEAKQFINEYNEYKNKIKNKQVMETRNVEITLETAQRWYGQGGEFKEMALSAYTEAELNHVRNEWENRFVGKKIKGYFIDHDESSINFFDSEESQFIDDDGISSDCKNIFKTEKQAKSALAYAQLTQLMALPEYNGNWVPDWENDSEKKFCIIPLKEELKIEAFCMCRQKICFKNMGLAERFMENNFDLLKQFNELD